MGVKIVYILLRFLSQYANSGHNMDTLSVIKFTWGSKNLGRREYIMGTQNIAEKKFKEWLDKKGYPYLYIEQSKDTFATFFRGTSEGPDFLISIPSTSIISVDVKERKLDKKYESFIIDEKEVEKLSSFERITRLPVWFTFSMKEIAYKTWYWISLGEVIERIMINISRKSHEPFRAIPLKDCITIGWDDGLYKLFGSK